MDRRCEPPNSGRKLSLTLGLVTLNEEGTIGASLGALLGEMNHLDVECEIIVVAGGQDGTVGIVQAMLDCNPRAKVIVDASPRGKPAALNTIFSSSRGDIVVLSDGDVVVGPGAIKLLLRAFDDPEVGCTSGRVLGAFGQYNHVMRASSLINDLMHLSRNERQKSEMSLDLASGYLLAVRRDLVDQIPVGVKSDDGYISLMTLSRGYRIAYAEDAIVYVNFPRSVSDFINQKMRTRYGHMELKDHFGGEVGRTAFRELRDMLKHSKAARRVGSYGMGTVMIALLLLAACWTYAYVRRIAPFLFKSPVWRPIKSTK
ncbi:MAG: glycosyltransferase [Methanobacteriota archaeon]|nr:MAG: glycosyltransferase [Euryarchaeota archaeon]